MPHSDIKRKRHFCMMKILLLIISLLVCNSLFAQTGWFEQVTGTDITLRSVYMTDANTGYCVGGDILIDGNDAVDRGIILKTTNGGSNWMIQSPPNFDKILYAVTFPTTETGYAAGRDGSTFAVFKTTNGGTNWIQQELPTTINTPPIYSLYFFDAQTGFAMGGGGHIFKTTNGGTNWTINSFSNMSNLYSVTFTSANTGYLCSDNFIYKTVNGGSNWATALDFPGISFQSVYFTDQNNGHVTGVNRIFKTTNAGVNWSSVELTGNNFSSIYFPSPDIGYCAGSNTAIYKTTDGGSSWNSQTQPGGTPLYSIFFANDTVGFAVGNVGYMLRTTTGGTVGISIISSEIPEKFALHQNYPNPFNPETVINYEIRERTHVSLAIYDVSGKLITQAINDIQNPGVYRYNFSGNNLPAGVYFYRLKTEGYSEVRKMVLIK